MAKSKKVLSLALAVVMAISVLSIGAFAGETTPTGAITVTADKTEGIQMGDTVTVTVAATASQDYFVGPTAVPVTYNADLFTASNVVGKNIFGDVITADDTDSDPTNVATNITVKDGIGTVIADITPYISGGNPVAPNLNGQNVVLYTFTLTAIAEAGSCDVAVLNDQKTATHQTGKLYMTSFDSSDASTAYLTTVGQTIDLTNATVNLTIGSAMQPADLALTDAGAAAGIIIDTHKTFGSSYAGVVYGFNEVRYKAKTYITNNCQATNGGSLLIKTSDGKTTTSGNYGTGTTITVLNSDGSESKKVYVVVIFGDIDGNGIINPTDISSVQKIVSNASLAPNHSVKRLAANCALASNANIMHIVNPTDISTVKKHVGGTKFDPATLAARHAKFNTFYQ